jgi:hypothetical protein
LAQNSALTRQIKFAEKLVWVDIYIRHSIKLPFLVSAIINQQYTKTID